MSKTYQSIRKQIEALEREAESLKRKEVEGVIQRIKDAIAVYGLTAADLGFAARGAKAKPAAAAKKAAKAAKKGAARKLPPKFRDENGNVWTGRGSKPRWLVAALAAGRKLEDFAV